VPRSYQRTIRLISASLFSREDAQPTFWDDSHEAIAFVKGRRTIAKPNTGFVRQLEIYGLCGWDLWSEIVCGVACVCSRGERACGGISGVLCVEISHIPTMILVDPSLVVFRCRPTLPLEHVQEFIGRTRYCYDKYVRCRKRGMRRG
jgi:hypothetical protein